MLQLHHWLTSVRKVRTFVNSFVVFKRRLLRVSTTVVECSLLCLVWFAPSCLESQICCKSDMAAFNAVISCLTTDVSSWISTAGSSNIDVRFATTTQTKSCLNVRFYTAHVVIITTLNANNLNGIEPHKYY